MNKRLKRVRDYLELHPEDLYMEMWFSCLVGTSVKIEEDTEFDKEEKICIDDRTIDPVVYGQVHLDLSPEAMYICTQPKEIKDLYTNGQVIDYIDIIWEKYGKKS